MSRLLRVFRGAGKMLLPSQLILSRTSFDLAIPMNGMTSPATHPLGGRPWRSRLSSKGLGGTSDPSADNVARVRTQELAGLRDHVLDDLRSRRRVLNYSGNLSHQY